MCIISNFYSFSFLNNLFYNFGILFAFLLSMRISFIFISLFSLLISAKQLPPKGDDGYKTFLTWNENRKLTWNDFQGKPMDNTAEVAMTASSVEFYYYTKNNQVGWTVTAKYFPKLSWSKKNLQSDYILKHEQLHFDITELYTRLFRKRLKESVKSIKDMDKIKSISKQIMKEWNNEENDYDRETQHSTDEKKQAEWNLNLQQRLDALKEFASK